MAKQLLAIGFIFLVAAGCAGEEIKNSSIKLYALDCGAIEISDMSSFSREGKFDGQTKSLVTPCFLIRHPEGDLFWEVGLDQSPSDESHAAPGDGDAQLILTDQLAQLGLKPIDIEYLAISHLHPDHTGNANLFAASTFIVNKAERAYMFSDEIIKEHADWHEKYSALEDAETILFEDEYDVFGDGRIVIKSMPGHTPGSSVMLLQLKNAGSLLFSGDLYTHAEARELRAVPVFNTNTKDTLSSMEQFEILAKTENARVIIQHEKADFEALPPFPKFLE